MNTSFMPRLLVYSTGSLTYFAQAAWCFLAVAASNGAIAGGGAPFRQPCQVGDDLAGDSALSFPLHSGARPSAADDSTGRGIVSFSRSLPAGIRARRKPVLLD